MKIAQVNEHGIQYLKAWVLETSKTDDFGPLCHTDSRALDAWCAEAEESMAAGNPPIVEMSRNSTKSGHPETFTIPADGIRYFEDDDMRFIPNPGGRPPKHPGEGGRQRPFQLYLTPALAARVLEHGPTVSAAVNKLLREFFNMPSKQD